MVGLMVVGNRRRAPLAGLVDGEGEIARYGEGEGEREVEDKSRPRVKESADCAGRVPVGEDE